MKLAFSGEARYPKFDLGYELYSSRVRTRMPVSINSYKRIVKRYCASLAERLYNEGSVSLPMKLGTLSAAVIKRKPKYREGKFIGFGKKDWKTGNYDGTYKAFGIVFLPNRTKNPNLRCFGFVANRALFKRLKERYDGYDCPWVPLEFNDEMI